MSTALAMNRASNGSELLRDETRAIAGQPIPAPARPRCRSREHGISLHSATRFAPSTGTEAGDRTTSEAVEAAVWFSDLRNFTMLTELLPAEEVLETLNAYLELIEGAVREKGGEILCLTGDAILIAFPADDARNLEGACAASLEAALRSFELLESLNQRRGELSKPSIRFGVGLDVGKITRGQVGLNAGPDRTTVGRSVNRAARLESLTKTVGPRLLLSEDFAGRIDRPVRALGRFLLKGIADPQLVFTLSERGRQEHELASEQATVFVVDDDPSIRNSITLLLDSHGIAARSYGCAEAFLSDYRPGQPGCLILDHSMPGLNGLELQKALCARECGIPVIFLSGRGDVRTSVQAVKAGAVDFLEKPVRADVLLECVTEALGSRAHTVR